MKILLGIILCSLWQCIECQKNLALNGKVAYTKTVPAKLCLNNCVNGLCITDGSRQLHECTNTDQDAPIFHTYKNNTHCYSRCITEDYSWCYTDDLANWDYCNPNETIEWVRGQTYTIKGDPCKDKCAINGSVFRCQTYWGTEDFCDPTHRHDFIKAYTYDKNYPCINKCTENWCYYDSLKNWDYCALPAHPRSRDWTDIIAKEILQRPFVKNVTVDENCTDALSYDFRGDRIRGRTDNLNKLAMDIENNELYDTVAIDFKTGMDNPVYSYTVEPGDASKNKPVIPRVIRALVTFTNLRGPLSHGGYHEAVLRNLALMGDFEDIGYLVPYSLGGPSCSDALYNFYPLVEHAEFLDPLTSMIREFLTQNPNFGLVDMLIVPLYKEGTIRPLGVSTHAIFHNGYHVKEHVYEYRPNFVEESVEIPTSTHSYFTPQPNC